MEQVSLDDLIDEILLHFLEYLDIKSLKSIRVTCKKLYSIPQEKTLWHSLVVKNIKDKHIIGISILESRETDWQRIAIMYDTKYNHIINQLSGNEHRCWSMIEQATFPRKNRLQYIDKNFISYIAIIYAFIFGVKILITGHRSRALDYNTIKKISQKFRFYTSYDITNNRYGNIYFLHLDEIMTLEIYQWIDSEKIEMILFNESKDWNFLTELGMQDVIIRNKYYIFL